MGGHDKTETSDGILRACAVLRAFKVEGETLSLAELVRRTSLKKTTVFRAVNSLVRGGVLERTGRGNFRSLLRPATRYRYRLGYAAQSSDSAFARDVTAGIREAAAGTGFELIEVDNRYSAKAALKSAETLIRERVDLAIEFQTYEAVAPEISARFSNAAIPLIAIDIPHPEATFYGANNYTAGLIGGHAAGRWVRQHWGGQLDEVWLLTISAAGALPNSRLKGTVVGLGEVLGIVSEGSIVTIDTAGGYAANLAAVRKKLRFSRARRVLVAALNDPSALGALRAFDEAGRLANCAVISQNACLITRAEMRRPGTRMIGSVAYFPERYGVGVIQLAEAILCRKDAPAAVFVKHQLITPANVDHYYPNDTLSLGADPETALLRFTH